MGRKINNTTALIAAFSLSIPTVVPAQQLVESCEADSFAVTAATASEAGLVLGEEQTAALQGAQVSEEIIVGSVDGEPALCLTVPQIAELGADDAQFAMIQAAQPDAQANVEAEAETEAEVTADAEPEAEEQVEQAQAEAEEQVESAIDNAEAAVEEAETEAETAAAETQEAVEEVETEATAEAEAEVETTAESDTAAAEAEVAVETEAEAEPETGEAEAQTETEAEAETAETDLGTVVDEAIESAEAEAASLADSLTEEMKAAAEEIEAQSAEQADPERQAEVAEQEAPTESAASNENAQAAEIEETVVTEEDSRSSSEEFQGQMETTANATASSDGGGLSDFEKALLVGLGAVVVGRALGDNSDAQVVSKSQDRVVVLQDGRYRVLRDDNELIERPGSSVRRETFEDGSTRTVVTRENGVQIMTIRDPELRVLRRVRIDPDGTQTVLIDDTTDIEPVEIATLPEPVEAVSVASDANADDLRAALERANRADRRFALYQVRNIERVRKLAPAIQLEAINFRTGSAVIDAQEAEELSQLGNLIADIVADNPGEVFLIEGHTDAVGNAAMNLALSDRRAESVALALTEYFDVPPENLVVQGYGESDLKVLTLGAERANRRAAVRRITPLITTANR